MAEAQNADEESMSGDTGDDNSGCDPIGCGCGLIVLALGIAILILCAKVAWSIVTWAWNW